MHKALSVHYGHEGYLLLHVTGVIAHTALCASEQVLYAGGYITCIEPEGFFQKLLWQNADTATHTFSGKRMPSCLFMSLNHAV